MSENANDLACVYYISDASCTDPYRDGYVGITSNEARRRSDQRRSGRFPAEFSWTILFRGTRQECAAVQKRYRPDRGIGWNDDRGNGSWRDKRQMDEAVAAAFMNCIAKMPIPTQPFGNQPETSRPLNPEKKPVAPASSPAAERDT